MAATGKNVPDVAMLNGYSKMLLYRVIKGESVNTEARSLISKLINMPVSEIWPEPQK